MTRRVLPSKPVGRHNRNVRSAVARTGAKRCGARYRCEADAVALVATAANRLDEKARRPRCGQRFRHPVASGCSAVPQPRRHQVGFAKILLAEQGIYRLRIEAAEDLLDEGARMVDETGRAKVGGARLLLVVQATRATHIFESVIALCQIGRGVPASMLNRALLEDALDVHWVAANPEIAPARADEHERLIELGERAMDQRFGRQTVSLTSEEQDELDQLRARYRDFRAPWTLASEPDRIALIKERWGAEAARSVDIVFEIIQRQNNALLHSSPIAYALAMSRGAAIPTALGLIHVGAKRSRTAYSATT